MFRLDPKVLMLLKKVKNSIFICRFIAMKQYRCIYGARFIKMIVNRVITRLNINIKH